MNSAEPKQQKDNSFILSLSMKMETLRIWPRNSEHNEHTQRRIYESNHQKQPFWCKKGQLLDFLFMETKIRMNGKDLDALNLVPRQNMNVRISADMSNPRIIKMSYKDCFWHLCSWNWNGNEWKRSGYSWQSWLISTPPPSIHTWGKLYIKIV